MNLLTKLKDEFAFVRGNLLVLIVSYILGRFSYSLYSPFHSLYIRELGTSPLLLGLMSSTGYAILALIRIPGAFIADRYGRKTIIAIFTYGVAIANLFYALAIDWRFIIVGIAISNISQIYLPALEALEADSIPSKRRGMGFAAINVIPMIAAIFAPPIVGFLVERLGLVPGMRIAYGVVLAIGIAVAVIRTLFLKETLENPKEFKLKELGSAFSESIHSITEAWRFMPQSVVFLTVILMIGAFEAPLFNLYMALYANDIVGISSFQWSIISTAWMVTTLVVGIPVGRMIDSIGRKKSILLAYLFSTPIIIFLILSRGFIQLVIVNIFFALGMSIMWPALSALQADLIPQDKRGRIMGTIGTLCAIAMVPSSAIFGLLYQNNPIYPFILAILLEIVTVIIIISKISEPKEMGI